MKTPDTKPGLPQHDRFTLWWVTGWFAIRHLLHFRSLRWEGEAVLPERAVLLIQNHFSWWDGYWAWLISRRMGKVFNVMMLQEQIAAHPFLTRCGAFPVIPGQRQAIEAIDTAAGLLKNNRNMVVIFPQGSIETQHQPAIAFAAGVERIIRRSDPKPTVLFAVVLVDYFSTPRPAVTIRLKEHRVNDGDSLSLQDRYNEFYTWCIAQQKS